MRQTSEFLGLLPAGGIGSRLAPLRYPKELLPIAYAQDGAGSTGVPGLRPRVVAEFALEAFVKAGASRCIVITAPWKPELMQYLGDGRHLGLELAYLQQETARGLPHAVDLAYSWLRDANVLFAMPDTLFQPSDCVDTLAKQYLAAGADLALGVFPSDQAHRLGPVVLRGDEVEAVYDKPAKAVVNQVWGAAVWGPRFTELLHAELARHEGPQEPVLGAFFQRAVEAGLVVKGHLFKEGYFLDVGTPEGIQEVLRRGIGH